MAQYLLSIYQPDAPPPPEVMARMDQIMANVDALVQESKDAGAWVFNGSLHPPSTATVLRLRDRDVLLTDGPYTEGKEHIGGFLIIRVALEVEALKRLVVGEKHAITECEFCIDLVTKDDVS